MGRLLVLRLLKLWAIAAWLYPNEAETYLTTAWQTTGQSKTDPVVETLVSTLNDAPSLREWLRTQQSVRPRRIKRVGFNVTSRHLGGNQPSDFGFFFENIPVMYFFNSTFTTLRYEPEFDEALEIYRLPLLDLETKVAPEID
jgi:hypothetical protein